MSQKIKLAILVHEGSTQTNRKAIEEAVKVGKIKAEVVAVISDAGDLEPTLGNSNPDYICLAGWKKIIPDSLLSKYPNKILNIHPGLIPDTLEGNVVCPDGTVGLWNKGKFTDKAIKNFINQKATYAGSSIHFLTNEFDFGPVLGRTFEKILPDDTVESLYARLKVGENNLYVEVLAKLSNA